jgi:hypothetical protein
MGIIKKYHDKKWTLQFLDALYNSIDIDFEYLKYLGSAYNLQAYETTIIVLFFIF